MGKGNDVLDTDVEKQEKDLTPKWYVVHTYSGYENKVKDALDNTIKNRQLEDKILEVCIPVEEVVEIKNGSKKTVKKKLFPGYVLIHMIHDTDTWYVVRNTRGVTGFVGPDSNKPVPLTEEEMRTMGIREARVEVDFKEGDSVIVTNGVWKDKVGVVETMNHNKQMLTINLDMLGRETLVKDLSFTDVKKI